MQYGSAPNVAPVRKTANLALAFALIAAALVCAVGIVSYAKASNSLSPISTLTTKLGSEYMVANALVAHATDMSFDENAPVPEHLADLAKAAEDEMKIDAEVMGTR
mmetsp:Transcript_61774/g.141411  ORF Transcript_61774/g.141411 Transcript_61774/m.141411 type:complete len:106 (+) Transcript_61774:26-343(+)